ncbi:LysR family transcriptional regulator [Allopusillimonas soli]|uniref:LysR family transcriptional regulator n=1 Tax=Allopusillimonas soli TaxID=659016 RepID=A0A853FEY8_9BURK|nr:LysR family transcriptional regulator [Allopusillimonas soli]NYT36586.1 LysR family transcriptional regulator [Allopusillimonas soli]TEA75078.1 LysR family transcriptional regulator [Allopusillimonas soli]
MDGQDRQLRYFLRIAALSSLSKAADELNLSQSGLSRHLAALEAYLGKPLFNRTGRGVTLTEAGRKLVDAALPSYARIDDTLELLRDKEGITQGDLRIATIHTFSYYFVSDLLARFLSKYEQVNLSVMARSSPDVVSLVEKGKADIGFVYDSAVASEFLESVPLFVDEMCLIACPGQLPAETDADLSTCHMPLVGFPEHYALRRMLKSAGLDDRVVVVAETIDAMLRLSSTGIGACVLPEHIPTQLLADYGLVKVRLEKPRLQRMVVAIVRHDTAAETLARHLLDMARSQKI